MQKFIFLLIITLTLSKDSYLPQHTLPVYGNASLGYYYVTIFVGHPPQQQSVIIDTGSGQLALPCNKCTNCNPKHINPPFDMKRSKTAEYVTCQSNDPQCKRCPNKIPTESCKFVISYAQGSSLQGIIIKDSIQFESFSQGQQIVTSFGCTTRQTNLFLKQQANGIFGLAPQRTSTFLQDLYKKHHGFSGQQLQFSLCLSANGGLMTVGKVNNELHLNPQSLKTTFSLQRNLYTLNGVGNVRIGKSLVHKSDEKLGVYGMFIDSGSTFTYLPRQNYLIFKKQLIQNCNLHKQLCDLATGQSVLCFHLKGHEEVIETTDIVFPPLIIELNQKQLKWKASKYFLLRDKTNRQICLGVQALDRFLLGANWMVDRDIVFNLKDKTVEIFSQSSCQNKNKKEQRNMGQFTNQVDGHKPLTYQNGASILVMETINGTQIIIIIGIILIVVGIVGLFIILFKQDRNKNNKKHNPISPVQTQDHIDISQIKQEQNNS